MNRGVAASPLSDAELTRAAQAGDAGSLGVLLARHEAGMRAVALGMIGYGPDTDDVVQDAALVAVRRITDVRNPAAEPVSQHVYDEVKRRLLDFDAGRVRIRRVEVWENDSACAICEE